MQGQQNSKKQGNSFYYLFTHFLHRSCKFRAQLSHDFLCTCVQNLKVASKTKPQFLSGWLQSLEVVQKWWGLAKPILAVGQLSGSAFLQLWAIKDWDQCFCNTILCTLYATQQEVNKVHCLQTPSIMQPHPFTRYDVKTRHAHQLVVEYGFCSVVCATV